MPTALITGGTGFIGRHLVRRLLSANWRIRLLVRNPANLDEFIHSNCQVTTGSLENPDACRDALSDADFIFNCAGNASTWDAPDAYWQSNVIGPNTLLDAIRLAGKRPKRIVHLSSVDVYGFPDAPASENQPLPSHIPFAYGASKREGEAQLVRRAREMAIPFTVFRPCNVIGPGSPFIARIGTELSSGLMMEIGHGHHHAGLLNVDNLVNALVWSIDSPDTINEIFNIRDPENWTWHEFNQCLKKGIQGRGLVIDLPYSVAYAAAKVISGTTRLFTTHKEPLLHPLLVQIFGKTCGHDIQKLSAAQAPIKKDNLETTLAASIAWFLKHHG